MKNSTKNPRQAAGEEAARLVKNNMVVGLGTGSTRAYAIKELGRRVSEGLNSLVSPHTTSRHSWLPRTASP